MSEFPITPPNSPVRSQTSRPSPKTPDTQDQRALAIFQQNITPPQPQNSTPTASCRRILPIPSTPAPARYNKAKKALPFTTVTNLSTEEAPTNPFQADYLPLVTKEASFSFSIPTTVDIKGHYTTPSRHQEICIKQPSQKQSCGPGATLMLLSHYIDLHSEIELGEAFWKFYVQSICVNQTTIMNTLESKTKVTSFDYQVKGAFYAKKEYINHKTLEKDPKIDYAAIEDFQDDLLKKIHLIQAQTDSPIIVSITNDRIDGHWIVIDHIADDGVCIRDPYSGQAHKLSLVELYQNWKAQHPVKTIYLEPKSSSSSSLPS